MLVYPKIDTLYDRGPDFTVDPDALRNPAFTNVKRWRVTEKIDGTNIRIGLRTDGTIWINGRSDNAQLPGRLSQILSARFTPEIIQSAFDPNTEAVIFGEGYGPGIQKGGGYGPQPNFRIFDVAVQGADRLYWLEPEAVADIAQKIKAQLAPYLCHIDYLPSTEVHLYNIVTVVSHTATEDGGAGFHPEGIVATADPQLFDRYGERVMWKLKFSDFHAGKR